MSDSDSFEDVAGILAEYERVSSYTSRFAEVPGCRSVMPTTLINFFRSVVDGARAKEEEKVLSFLKELIDMADPRTSNESKVRGDAIRWLEEAMGRAKQRREKVDE